MRTKGHRSGYMVQQSNMIADFYNWMVYEGILRENPVRPVIRRYLAAYKTDSDKQIRQIITVDEAARLVNSAVDIRDKALICLLLKTGIRRNEARMLDVDGVRWDDNSITLKSTKKRSNRVVYFDPETSNLLRRWLAVREIRAGETGPLWTTTTG